MRGEYPANQTVKTLPITKLMYHYCEAPWIRWFFRGLLLSAAAGLIYMGLAAHGPEVLIGMFVAALILFVVLVAIPHGENALHFACSHDGIYFPERKLLAQRPASWLLVPWRNVLDYRVQRMLDETSGHGIVLALVVSPDEEKAYFSKNLIFGRLRSGWESIPQRVIFVGYVTFLPRPDQVLINIRKLDSLRRVSAIEDDNNYFLEQDGQG